MVSYKSGQVAISGTVPDQENRRRSSGGLATSKALIRRRPAGCQAPAASRGFTVVKVTPCGRLLPASMAMAQSTPYLEANADAEGSGSHLSGAEPGRIPPL